jgi:hypothetical protein
MRSIFVTALLAGIALVVTPGAALAGPGCDGFDVVTHIFEVSDTDGSGTLSREEFAESDLERYGVPFDEYDADHDGQTSLDEYLDLYDRHHTVEDELES